jgi:FlaA1/EpsC-like NDP-sugar epimerase
MVKRFLAVVVLCAAALMALALRAHQTADMAVAVFWLLVLALLAAGVLHLVVNVWRGAWRYEQTGSSVVRIRRASGDAEVLTAAGWRPLTAAPVPHGARAPEQ